ncbi:MAG: SpoIIE family protein phosphatase [candidate division KSB1 bacterium]|nr:SpoIIE family protein phosphatase [candidate division KSB1 bacterium]
MKKPDWEQLRVPAHVDYLREIREFVARATRKYRCSSRVANALRYAAEEAASNVIKHAYRQAGGTITVRVRGLRDRVELSIIDQGRYFDPRRVRPPDLREYVEKGRRGGLGIFIIRKLVDQIDYRRTAEGNELRLVKFRESGGRRLLSVPIGLKVRYTVIACALVTLGVGVAYFLQFGRVDDQVVARHVQRARDICVPVANSVASALAEASSPTEMQLFAGRALKSSLKGNEQFVLKAFVVDPNGVILFSTRLFEIEEQFTVPPTRKVVNEWASYYRLPDGVEVFDITAPVVIRDGEPPIGQAHIWIRKEEANREIRALRLARLRNSLILLLISYGGVFFLVYLVTSPLRRLAHWVKEAGRGGPPSEEIAVEEGTEVAEIAKAFTSMTQKIKESEKTLAEKQELDRDIELAKDIQRALLPSEAPQIEGYEISALYEAAKVVGGDYYDFLEVDKDVYGIAVADVSGKGVPGSLVMTMIRTALRTEARGVLDAAEVLRRVNDAVVRDMKKGMFVTIFYAILDTRRRRLNYASAGHNPMIVYRGRTRKTYYLNPRGLPIGLDLPDPSTFAKSIESDTIRLAEDDIIILYTDGITEAMNPRRELFGEERLLQVVRDYAHLPAQVFVEKLRDELHSFTEGQPQNDDITVVVVKEKLTPEKVEFNRAKEAHRLVLAGKSIREACELAGITTYAYYTRYKKLFDTRGLEAFEIEDEETSIEAKHLSIEEKVKIYDVILRHPEYGPKRISEELNTERYGFTQISESKIYDELVRSRLNTRQMREAFAARNAHKNRPKPPGAPLLTLDGEPVIHEPPVPSAPEVEEEAGPLPQEETAEPVLGEEVRDRQEMTEGRPPERAVPEVVDEFLEAFVETEEEGPVASEGEERAAVASPEAGVGTPEGDTELPISVSLEELLLASEGELDELTEAGGSLPPQSQEGATEDIATLISRELEQQLGGGTEREEAEVASEASGLDFSDLDVLAGIETLLQSELAGSPEDGRGEKESLGEDGAVSFVDLVRSIEEEIRYATLAPAPESQDRPKERKEEGRFTPRKREGERPEELRRKHLARGLHFYKRKEYEKAIEEFRRVVQSHPGDKEAWNILGNAYYRAGLLDEALRAYERVKELDPLDPDPYENMGVIFANRGHYARAIEEWQNILRMDPSRKDILYHIQKAKRLMARQGRASP